VIERPSSSWDRDNSTYRTETTSSHGVERRGHLHREREISFLMGREIIFLMGREISFLVR
jgi:hypothetical protein